MVPAGNLLRRHYTCYETYFSTSYMAFQKPPPALRSPEFMGVPPAAEERDEVEQGNKAGTSSRAAGDQCCEDRWLQLGIGDGILPPAACRSPALSELELFSPRPSAPQPVIPMFPPPAAHGAFEPRETPWGLWTAGGSVSPAFQSLVLPMESSAPSSRGLRLVRPPERPPAGVWFSLRPAENQVREPFLPQLPKSYLRIKDGRMTVGSLNKYLVTKLGGLEDESEVEISCRGLPLLPSLTLQHVRDNIWHSPETSTSLTLLPESHYNEQHLMALEYCRRSS